MECFDKQLQMWQIEKKNKNKIIEESSFNALQKFNFQ